MSEDFYDWIYSHIKELNDGDYDEEFDARFQEHWAAFQQLEAENGSYEKREHAYIEQIQQLEAENTKYRRIAEKARELSELCTDPEYPLGKERVARELQALLDEVEK